MSAPRWTAAEIAKLIDCRAAHLSLKQILKIFPQRSAAGIQEQIKKLIAAGRIAKFKENPGAFIGHANRRKETLRQTGFATWDDYQVFRNKGFTKRELVARHRGDA